ncbi:hypothetical protein E2C01_069281 [Portunus trituberculatus]|uniref:Uncharacterized protein n=1 Tax=Portunus trituberculatus TaxID=210409 RepID=A0A5B7HPN0_PORTR|nr:hypothetical protein [Portunus trituberculatus]
MTSQPSIPFWRDQQSEDLFSSRARGSGAGPPPWAAGAVYLTPMPGRPARRGERALGRRLAGEIAVLNGLKIREYLDCRLSKDYRAILVGLCRRRPLVSDSPAPPSPWFLSGLTEGATAALAGVGRPQAILLADSHKQGSLQYPT